MKRKWKISNWGKYSKGELFHVRNQSNNSQGCGIFVFNKLEVGKTGM